MPCVDKRTLRAVLMLFCMGLLVACDTRGLDTGAQKAATVTTPARGIRGQVLDMTGAPAGGVLVRGMLISNNSASLISNNSASLVGNNAAGFIVGSGARYRVQSGFETQTAPDGSFSFTTSDDQILTLEAIQREGVKAIKLGAEASTGSITLQLAQTGHLHGKVVPADPAIRDLLNVDVFIPGTSYVAKTDAQGGFTLLNLPRGTFSLVADHRDLGRAVLDKVTVVSGKTVQVPALELSTHPPALSSLAPADGAPGARVTLTGQHFGVSSGKHPEVLLNGVAAQVVTATDTTITAIVPLGAVSGEFRVAVNGLESANLPFKVLRRLDLFPDYRQGDATDPVAQPPSTDVLAIGASRRYHVRAFDTEGRLVASPSISWSSLGSVTSGFSSGMLVPTATGRLAIAAISGSLSSGPLAIDILPRLVRVDVLPNPLAPLNPQPLDPVLEAQRSDIPDSVQLRAKVVLEDAVSRELPILYRSLHPDLTVSADGLVTVKPGSADGQPRIEIVPVADPSKKLELAIPVLRQGDLSFIIQ